MTPRRNFSALLIVLAVAGCSNETDLIKEVEGRVFQSTTEFVTAYSMRGHECTWSGSATMGRCEEGGSFSIIENEEQLRNEAELALDSPYVAAILIGPNWILKNAPGIFDFQESVGGTLLENPEAVISLPSETDTTSDYGEGELDDAAPQIDLEDPAEREIYVDSVLASVYEDDWTPQLIIQITNETCRLLEYDQAADPHEAAMQISGAFHARRYSDIVAIAGVAAASICP